MTYIGMFDATQAEVAYRAEQIQQSNRNVRLRRRRRAQRQARRYEAAIRAAAAASLAEALEPPAYERNARHGPQRESQEKVSAR